jgi:hemerythrin-like domain-containing protein
MAKIYEVLKREHAEVHALLDALRETDEPEAKRRTAVLAQVVEHVTAHSRAEQEVIYPVLATSPDASTTVTQALAHHGEIETALRELVACDVHDELWIAKLEVLRAAIDNHVDREEDEVFAALRKVLDDERAERLADDFGRRKAVLTGHAA